MSRRLAVNAASRSRGVAAALTAALALGLSASTAHAADIRGNPVISGIAQVGQQLSASASWTPPHLTPSYSWLRCESPRDWWSCQAAQTSPDATYVLQDGDLGRFMRVWVSVGSGRNRDAKVSDTTAAVAPRPAPVPTATPTPTPTPTPEPTPQVFDAVPPQPTPVPTQGTVLHQSGSNLRMMRPAPTVRLRGTLSARGANITLFSVRAPKRSSISVTCKGSGCPRKTYSTRQRTVRVRAFERHLPARTRIEVRVRRAGYYGKSTVLVIRKGKAPFRLDRCLSARGAYTACPKST
ncbi:hypothetical protein DVA67_022460 [Solirubrobacter sp. CPCC 204708]|uniref:Uncharacterized protein n=1 Tax=Solirubrobacter deserti TaxID=2282478 RepID=A0ABT4RHV5_9ACTN|nr:hypothetical protein [Solirubrobacter deserti]MBE2318756.1 hypothetical protein [Solirubrobacter deserti]MDA0138135.1 hypothetical protein [Solirubrobacter deserti]